MRGLARIPEDTLIAKVMMSVLSRRFGCKVREIEVPHLSRKGGTQSLKGLALWLRVGATCFYPLCGLRSSQMRRNGRQLGGGYHVD